MPKGVPSHDTIQRVLAMAEPEYLQGLRQELLNSAEGEKIRKRLSLDGKTQSGDGNKAQKANRIVRAVTEGGFCVWEKPVDEKPNETTAIPELLNMLNVKGQIISVDAMREQKEIAKTTRKKWAGYALSLKKNRGCLYEGVELYFSDPHLPSECAYAKTMEKACGGMEKREYWQTGGIARLHGKKERAGLKAIAMTRNTRVKNGKETREERYFLSSPALDVKEIARAIRGHWMAESRHWHLGAAFREGAGRTF